MNETPLESCSPMRSGWEGDVCVVGAGIAGLTTAYFLSRAGKRVLVLDRDRIGSGETCRTSAHLSNLLDYRYSEIIKTHSTEVAQIVAESHSTAIQVIEDISQREAIKCGFKRVSGYLVPADDDGPESLDEEREAAASAGLTVNLAREVPLLRTSKGFALHFPGQAQFHPLRYVNGLAKAVLSAGGQIYCGTEVEEIEGGDPCTLRLKEGAIVRASSVVLGSSTPFSNVVTLHTKQAAYRTYVCAFPLLDRGGEDVLIWDTANPYHYVRVHRSADQALLLVGGEDHKTGQDKPEVSPETSLSNWASARFHIEAVAQATWSGQVLEPVDQLAFIGRNPGDHPNVYVVTGTSGNGLTYGTISGILLSDLIENRKNPWEEVYDPARMSLRSTPKFVTENIDVVAQYADWVTPGEVNSIEEVQPGTGSILRAGAKKLAIYRESSGRTHQLSAVCPHLGCVVSWNQMEHTWDCPCHGSRFSPQGQVLNGPAVSGLAPAES